jgi:phenylacetate-CoA ligase
MTDDDRELWDPATQGRSPEETAAAAREGIARVWRRIWELPVPFYRGRYEAAGFGPDTVPPLDEIPRTNKADLRASEAAHPPFGDYRSVGLDQAVRLGASTGTTGTPILFFYSKHDLEVHVEVARRSLWRYGVRPGWRWTHSWPQGIYPTGVSAGRQFLDLGVLEIPVGMPFTREVAADHLRLWQILEPDGFMITGSQLQTYEDVGTEIGIDFASFLKGSTIAFLEAACQFEGPRQRLESHYGFRLHNIAGASEIPGFATSDCRFHTGLHCSGDHFVIQVCDPATGREVPPGERGSLVITAFDIDATFIRYDLEDIVVQDVEPCPCGDTGPRYTLLGRAADLVTVGGRQILPLDVQLAADDLGAPEFQVGRDSDGTTLQLQVEADGRGPALETALGERLGVPVAVVEVPRGSLPRSTFKPRRVS